jgi:HlyD family secretion protein
MAKQKRKSNKMMYWLIGAVGFLIVFLVVGKSAGWIGKPKEMEVEIAKAKRVTIVEKVSASGTVQPVTEVKIAPEVSGEIIDLLIEEGDSVRKGQTLVKIRPDTWQSQLDVQRPVLASSVLTWSKHSPATSGQRQLIAGP